jgi:hypothetical protein
LPPIQFRNLSGSAGGSRRSLAIGFVGSVALYLLLLGPRPNIAAAAGSMGFWMKFVDAMLSH